MTAPWLNPFLVKSQPETLLKKNFITSVHLLKIFRTVILAVPKLADKREKGQLNQEFYHVVVMRIKD